MVKFKDTQFCLKNLKIKRKKNKKILTFWSGDLNPRFSVIFPPKIWIFMESEGDEIISKQASKRDRTLPRYTIFIKDVLISPNWVYCKWWFISGGFVLNYILLAIFFHLAQGTNRLLTYSSDMRQLICT